VILRKLIGVERRISWKIVRVGHWSAPLLVDFAGLQVGQRVAHERLGLQQVALSKRRLAGGGGDARGGIT
jgi:hypothetical protein